MVDKKHQELTTRHLIDRAIDNHTDPDSLSYELAFRLQILMDNPDVDIGVFSEWARCRSYEVPDFGKAVT